MRHYAVWKLAIVWAISASCLACEDDTIPQGPDLVACHCTCTTSTATGVIPPGGSDCLAGGACAAPCPNGKVCDTRGGCSALCAPPASALGTSILRQNDVVLHTCIDASNASQTATACQQRCDNYANGSIVTCASSLLKALGLEDVVDGIEDAVPDDFRAKVSAILEPNDADSVAGIIVEECGTWALDKVTGTCGAATSGIGGLVDLLFCIWSPLNTEGSGFSSTRTCELTSDGQGVPYKVAPNGCPASMSASGGTGGGTGGTGGPPPTDGGTDGPILIPVGGSKLGATAAINPTQSQLSISGPDIGGMTSGTPSGEASAGRLGSLLILSELTTSIPDGQLVFKGNNVSLSNGSMLLQGPVAAALGTGSTFSIPAGKVATILTGSLSGKVTSLSAVNVTPVVGKYDEVGGFFSLAGNFALQGINANVEVQLDFAFVNRPPAAKAGPDQTVECTLPSRLGEVQLSALDSFDPDPGDQIASYTWTLGRQMAGKGAQVTARLGLGTRIAQLTTVDTHGSLSRATALITVADTRPPTFPALAPATNSLCGAGTQTATVAVPAVTDACTPDAVTVTGALISSNGSALATPLPIVNGQVTVSTGSHVIRWTATDQAGNSSTATQTLNVRPGIQAAGSVALADRAVLRTAGGGFATVGNTGAGTVTGVQSQTGSIFAKGNVFLRDRAIVNGDVRAGGTITFQNLFTVTGTQAEKVTVSLPAGRTLAGVVFPTTNAGPIPLPPDGARLIAPGAYAAVTVNSRATLTLRTGTYYFDKLDLEPQSKLNLDQSAGPIQLYVRTSIIHRGQIVPIGGNAAGFVLGYAGTSAFGIESPFPAGTVIAPNAAVTIGSLGMTAFSGQLFAKDINVRPDAVVTCVQTPGSF